MLTPSGIAAPGTSSATAGSCTAGRIGLGLGVGVVLAAAADDASAAAFAGIGPSMGLVVALATLVLLKAWQTHLVAGGLSTAVGLLTLAAGALLLWRSVAQRRIGGLALVNPGPALAPPAQVAPAASVMLPATVERSALLAELRAHFVALQSAWDAGACEDLRRLTTSEMFEELSATRQAGLAAPTRSEVLDLDAHLVAFDLIGSTEVVCIEFCGTARESAGARSRPFRELWMMTRTNGAGASWRLARHQALL